MTIAELIAKYNTVGTGLFRTGQTRGIGSDDMRDFVVDLTTLTDIPVDLSSDFWPLSGAADLTGPVTIDGNNFDLIFGSPNRLGAFEIYSNTDIIVDSAQAISFFSVQDMQFDYNDGLGNISSLFLGNSGGVPSATLGTSDGVNSSSFSFSPDHYHIVLGDAHIHSDGTSIAMEMDDGVDISTLSITPTGIVASIDTDGIDFTNGLNLTDDTNGYSIISDGTRFRILANIGGTSVVDVEPTQVRLSSQGQINLDAILTLGEQTPATITANQNNYTADNLLGITYRLNSDASRNITGWVPGGDSPMIICINTGANDIVFTHEDLNSTASNRFIVPGGGSLTLTAGLSAIWLYDSISTRWRLIGYTG